MIATRASAWSRRMQLIAAVLAVAGLLALSTWILPTTLNRALAPGMTATDRAATANGTRAALVALIAALAASGTLVYTARTYALAKAGQVTDRFSKAVEQLGRDLVAVRVGGVYALERIARDSPSDALAVREVLAAFVRQGTPAVNPQGDVDYPEDLQAAVTVLGRLRCGPQARSLRLDNADLRGADLSGAVLVGARLQGAHLGGANLMDADLRDAVLHQASLAGASLHATRLEQADLTEADFAGAELYAARLTRGQLTKQQLAASTDAASIQWRGGGERAQQPAGQRVFKRFSARAKAASGSAAGSLCTRWSRTR